jgi:CheY-like chemotaxis protein
MHPAGGKVHARINPVPSGAGARAGDQALTEAFCAIAGRSHRNPPVPFKMTASCQAFERHGYFIMKSTKTPANWILLIDDEEDILPEYQEFLAACGHEALISSDSDKAFRIVLAEPRIGIVVTDLRMAGRDGASLIRDLRLSLPEDRRLQFIILTGDASSQTGGDMADIPVFLKPLDTVALCECIERMKAQARC